MVENFLFFLHPTDILLPSKPSISPVPQTGPHFMLTSTHVTAPSDWLCVHRLGAAPRDSCSCCQVGWKGTWKSRHALWVASTQAHTISLLICNLLRPSHLSKVTFLHPRLIMVPCSFQVALDVIEELCYEMGLHRVEALDEYAVFLVTHKGNNDLFTVKIQNAIWLDAEFHTLTYS